MPSVVMRICCSRAGQPDATSVAPTSAAVRRRRTPPRIAEDQALGALALETIAANRTKERDPIDAGPARRFGHVAARLLEELRDVLTLEAFEQLGFRHAKWELLQPLVRSLALQGKSDPGGVGFAAQSRRHAEDHQLLEIVA